MKTKTIHVKVRNDEEQQILERWDSQNPEVIDQVLKSGYTEGVDDGTIAGYAFAGLALLGAAGVCKILNFIKRK